MNDAMVNGLGGQAAIGAMLETEGGHGRTIGMSVRSVRIHFLHWCWRLAYRSKDPQDWVRERQEAERRSHMDHGQ
jgi:hypothetical protein